MEYQGNLSSARDFAGQGNLGEWVQQYLCSEEGHNLPFAQGLRQEPRVYLGPMALPLERLEGCSGPEPDIQFPAYPQDFENRVQALVEFLENGGELPPVIVNITGGRLIVNDGNHRVVAYTRLGAAKCQGILWATAGEESEAMLAWVEKVL